MPSLTSFILTLVQGDSPPTSIMLGIDRFAGITIGLVTLLVVSLLLAPVTDAAIAVSGFVARMG